MAGGGEDSFIEPLGLLLGLTAFVALLLSYAKQSTIISFILVGVMVNSVGVTKLETTTLGHFSEVGILILLFTYTCPQCQTRCPSSTRRSACRARSPWTPALAAAA